MLYNLNGYTIHLDQLVSIDKTSDPSITINYKDKPSVTIPFSSNHEAKGEMAYLVKVWRNYTIDKAFKPSEEIQ